MRLFYLQNESGSRIPLNNETGIFLTEPEGLGLEFGDTFADIGEGFFRMVSKTHTQKIISAKLNFIKEPYQAYNRFVNWCMASKQLYFVYKPYDMEYYIHIEIESIEKNELTRLGYLSTPIKFRYLSPWYIPYPASISAIGSGIVPFRWDVSRFGSSDVLIGSSAESYTAEIHPEGHLPAALKIKFVGVTSNPRFILTGKDTGIEYGQCAINKTFSEQSTIELCTMYEDSYIKSYDLLGQETDLISDVDLTHDPFFKIPLSEDCILTIADDEVLSGTLSGSIYFYYRSV